MNTALNLEPVVADSPAPARSRRLGIALIAAAAVALELAVSARYGYVRDELYFLSAGHHLAFGYVDQPPLAPLIARISAALSGNTLVGLRLVPALGIAVLVVATAAMSRLLGAGRRGQLLAALAAATCGEYLAGMHELTTTMPDFVFWAITLLLVTRLLASRDPRWWLAIGGCVGVAMEAKWNIAFLAVSLVAGIVSRPDARSLLRSRYLLIGGLIVVAIAAPDVIWQAANGWPNLSVFRVLQTQAGHNRATYWPAQVLFTGLALTPVWVTGLIWGLRSEQARRFRPATIGGAIAIVIQFALGGKPYYSGGAYSFLLASGCVPIEHWLASRRRWPARRGFQLMVGAMIASAAVIAPIALPLLPAKALHTVPLQKINYDLAESIAWPKQVALIAREYHALPTALRGRTTILAGNYGEAGALDRYGPGLHLPPVHSGANTFWLWGPPPPSATAAIAINVDPALLHKHFRHVALVATFWNGLGVSDDEQGARIFLATGLTAPWSRTWAAFRHYA